MKKKVLILTDHSNHSAENSLYELAVKMMAHEQTLSVDIATRAIEINSEFFVGSDSAALFATTIDTDFSFNKDNHPLSKNFSQVDISTYDLVWLRLPPLFPIVLKPFNEYGGRGIVKIEGDIVNSGNQSISFNDFSRTYESNPIEYLAVKYLKNVKQGDKRIVVVNGEILGASLRLPADNSWLCNVAMGGSSNITQVEKEEEEIIRLINPTLSDKGIVMYGVDTLVGDDGKRVLSEINTTSIGGLPQIAAMNNLPLVERAIDLIWEFYNDKKKQNG